MSLRARSAGWLHAAKPRPGAGQGFVFSFRPGKPAASASLLPGAVELPRPATGDGLPAAPADLHVGAQQVQRQRDVDERHDPDDEKGPDQGTAGVTRMYQRILFPVRAKSGPQSENLPDAR